MASLAPHQGEVTYGSVAELTYKEKEALDEYEGGYVIAPAWSHDPTVLPRAQCYQPRHRHRGLGQRQRDIVRRVVEQRSRMQQHGWSGSLSACRLNTTSIELTTKTLPSVAGHTALLSWPQVLVDANYTAHIVARTIAPSGTERRC